MFIKDFASLKKQLSQRSSHRCYLLAIPDDYERARAAKILFSYLLSEGSSPTLFSGSDLSMREVYDALQSPSLFGGESVVFFDEVEKLGKKDLSYLSEQIASLQFAGHLILGARSKTTLVSAVDKSGIVFDLTEEKPWDKEKRIIEQMHLRVQNGGKRLSSDAAPLLLEKVGSDPALLDQEMDKLICFVGDRPTVERSDVLRMTPFSRLETLWKIAEEMIWEGLQSSITESFYALVPLLRSQLQIGLKIISLHGCGHPKEAWGDYLPKIWPKTLEKRSSQAVKLGPNYFRKGLELLFEIETLSRTGSSREEALCDLFRITLASYVPR